MPLLTPLASSPSLGWAAAQGPGPPLAWARGALSPTPKGTGGFAFLAWEHHRVDATGSILSQPSGRLMGHSASQGSEDESPSNAFADKTDRLHREDELFSFLSKIHFPS